MKQYISTLFLVLLSSFCINALELDQESERSIDPLVFQSYKVITVGQIRRGYVISEPGNYAVTASYVPIRSTDDPTGTTITVGGSGDTRGLIKINSSNVTLNLGGAHFDTEFNEMGMSTINAVGVTVADDKNNVTIKNGIFGSGYDSMMMTDINFDSAVVVGQNCNNIVIEDITAYGCNGEDTMGMITPSSAIEIKGAVSNTVNSITLKNLVLSNNATSSLKCSYCNDLYLENIQCNGNDYEGVLMMTDYPVVDLNNCNQISGEDLEINNNPISSGTVIFQIDTCFDVNLNNISVTNSEDDGGMMSDTIEGVLITDSNNVYLSNISINNLQDAEYGLRCTASKNVTLEYLQINNCTSYGAMVMMGVYNASLVIEGSQAVSVNHATLSNNTMAYSFASILCQNDGTSDNEGIFLNDIEITNNSATTMGDVSDYTAIDIQDTLTAQITNCTIAQNTSTDSFYGVKVSNDAQYVTCDNVKIINNSASGDDVNDALVAGFYCYDSDSNTNGLKFTNCSASSNNGTREAYGFYIRSAEYAFLDNCTAKGNAAQTSSDTHKPSAGLFMQDCSYATVQNSSFINNKANDADTASVDDATDTTTAGSPDNSPLDLADTAGTPANPNTNLTIGAGIINRGNSSSDQNIGNSFINCVCNGNGTQLTLNPTLSASYYTYDTGVYRYSTKHALAVGAANQWTKFTTYKNCTFNNNGISQKVVGIGLLNINQSTASVKMSVIECTANNNNYFGFCDDGALRVTGSFVNCEMYFIQCLAISNGSIDSTPAAAQYTSAADSHRKNCFVYFSTGATSTVPPFIQVTFDDVNTDIGTNTSKYMNLSIIKTT